MSLNLGSLGMEDASFDFGGSYIMALDCGTTSVLATIVDEYGCIVAQARRSVKTSFPRPGWVEQDPMAVLASRPSYNRENGDRPYRPRFNSENGEVMN